MADRGREFSLIGDTPLPSLQSCRRPRDPGRRAPGSQPRPPRQQSHDAGGVQDPALLGTPGHLRLPRRLGVDPGSRELLAHRTGRERGILRLLLISVRQTQPAGRSVRDDAPTDVICNPDTPWESAKLWGAELPRVWRLS